MSGGLGVLSMAWVEAEAATPLGWRLMALVRQPDSDDWQATATGPLDGQTVHGRGGRPDQALQRLADELRRIRGPMTGYARQLVAPLVAPAANEGESSYSPTPLS